MADILLALQSAGLTSALQSLKDHWLPGQLIGLGSADVTPDQFTSLAVLMPADFSGYPGLLALGLWGAVTLVGPRAFVQGPTVTYTHNGGPKAQTVFTYYITDPLGTLLRAVRLPGGPATLFRAGQTLTVRPQLTLRSEY
jgi:hypothetical protein